MARSHSGSGVWQQRVRHRLVVVSSGLIEDGRGARYDSRLTIVAGATGHQDAAALAERMDAAHWKVIGVSL